MAIVPLVLAALAIATTLGAADAPAPASTAAVRFVVVSDCHMYGPHASTFADLTCAAILADPAGPGDFLVAVGDMDPFTRVRDAVAERLIAPLRQKGVAYRFYPVVGNHDLYNTSNSDEFRTTAPEATQTAAIIAYHRTMLADARPGPDLPSRLPGYEDGGSRCTTYSFDRGPCHFVALDLYVANDKPGRGNGNFPKALATWLEADLAATDRPHIVVFAHEPLLPYETATGKGKTVEGGSLIDAGGPELLAILKRHRVAAYLSGHSHRFGTTQQDGTTHINTGITGVAPGNTWVAITADGARLTYQAHVNEPVAGGAPRWVEHAGTIR